MAVVGSGADEQSLVAGQVLGRFKLIRPLGRGAMGAVWAARDAELDREVALKVLHMRASLDGSDQARLRREAQAMARLEHPNVVAIYDLGAADGRVFCAMRLVDGVTLRAWLATRRPWREVLAVMIAAGRGLAAAHAVGLVHRDIKPENILIGRDGRALVTDFGLAKHAEPARPPAERAPCAIAEAGSLTRTGAVLGTPAYMAPEQLAGADADAASDQFALCATIYEALFGVRPFAADTVDALAAAIALGPRRPPALRGVPARVVRCLCRGLAVSRAARWPSVATVLDALDRALGKRRRSLIVAAIAAAGTLVSGALVLGRGDPAELVRFSAERQMSSVWNAGLASRVRLAFVASASPVAAERADRVIRRLDGYRAEWLIARLDAWVVADARNRQAMELLERRLICLDRLALSLGALVTLLLDASASEVDGAAQATYQLEPVASCAEADRIVSLEINLIVREINASSFRLAWALAELARITSHRSPLAALPLYDEALEMDVVREGHDAQSDAETLEEVAGVALAAGRPEFALRWIDRYPWAADRLIELRAKLERARRE